MTVGIEVLLATILMTMSALSTGFLRCFCKLIFKHDTSPQKFCYRNNFGSREINLNEVLWMPKLLVKWLTVLTLVSGFTLFIPSDLLR